MDKIKHVYGYLQFKIEHEGHDIELDKSEIAKEFLGGKRVWQFPNTTFVEEYKDELVDVSFDDDGIPDEDTNYLHDEPDNLVKVYIHTHCPEVVEGWFDEFAKNVESDDGTINLQLKKFIDENDPRKQ